jgi:uncharacterized membrane protein YfcA
MILLSLLMGSPLGVIAGSRAVGWVPERGLRLTLATVLIVVGVGPVWSAYPERRPGGPQSGELQDR